MLLDLSARLRRLATCLLVSCFLTPAMAGPITNPSVVNTSLPGNQSLPGLTNIAASGNGEKTLLWRDYLAGVSYVQKIDSNGVLSPTQIPVVDGQYISADRVGNFLITGANSGVTLYHRNGSIRTNTFRAHPDGINAVASMDADGNISALYSKSVGQSKAIAFRRFSPTGSPLGTETTVWASIATDLSLNAIASDAYGNITATWTIVNAYNPQLDTDVWVQRFNLQGQAISQPTLVPSALPGIQDGGSLAVSPQGAFAIAWNSNQSGSGWEAYVQRFNVSGFAVGAPIRLNQTTLGVTPLVHLSTAEDGSFVATWKSDPTPPATGAVLMAKQFKGDGTPIGSEFQVDPGSTDAFYANSAMDPAGNFTVAWTTLNSSVNYADVKMRSYRLDAQPTVTNLYNNQPAQGLAGGTGSWNYFKITVPPGVGQMTISMAGPAGGDGDMYIRFGGLPTATAWDIRPYVNGSNELAVIGTPPPGDFYIAIYGYVAYSGVSLAVSY